MQKKAPRKRRMEELRTLKGDWLSGIQYALGKASPQPSKRPAKAK